MSNRIAKIRAIREVITRHWDIQGREHEGFHPAVDFANRLDEIFKPKRGLDLRAGRNFVHYVDRATNASLCGREYKADWQPTHKRHSDCPGCTIAIQRKYAEEAQ